MLQNPLPTGGKTDEIGHRRARRESDIGSERKPEQIEDPARSVLLEHGSRGSGEAHSGVLVPRGHQPVGGEGCGQGPSITQPKNRPDGIAISPGSATGET